MDLRRLSKIEQLDLLRLLEAEQRVVELQGRPITDYLREHFLAENADQNRKGAALVLVRSIAEQSKDPAIRTTAEAAVGLLEGKLGALVAESAKITPESHHAVDWAKCALEAAERGQPIDVRNNLTNFRWLIAQASAPGLTELREAAEDVLRGGGHDGPCTNEDEHPADRGACDLHWETAEARRERLRRALAQVTEASGTRDRGEKDTP